jgi:hypothetical protein
METGPSALPELGRSDIGPIAKRFDRRIDPLPLRFVAIASLIMIGGALSGWPRSFAAELPWLVPEWLQAHVGEGEGQIAPVVLQRARALYLKKVSEGAVNNAQS